MLVQKAASFAQLRNGVVSPLQASVADFLNARASKTSSTMLALIATRMRADPFTKAKKMINDMITKLMEEANEEAEHKGWCDTEMATNKHTRDSKTEQADKLSAEIDFLSAKSTKLTEDITELSNGIATIDKAVAQATADREAEKAKNTETIADAKAATTAVSQATAVLKEFYAKAGEATALVQRKGPAEDAPETFDSAYQGNQDQAGGVLGMLEVIQSDFAELESTTTAAEAEASDTFTTYMNDSKTNKAVKETDVQHKTTAKQETESAIQEAT